jgi:hypothetical protein
MRSTLAAELEVAGNIMFGEVEIPLLNPTICHLLISKTFTLSFSTTMGFVTFLLHPTYLRRAVGRYGSNIPCSSPGRIRGRLPHHWVPTILGTASNRLIITPIHVVMWMVYLVGIPFPSTVFLTCAGNTITYFNTLGTCIPVGSHSVLDRCYKRPQT